MKIVLPANQKLAALLSAFLELKRVHFISGFNPHTLCSCILIFIFNTLDMMQMQKEAIILCMYEAINNRKTTETAAEKFIARFSCHLQSFLLDGRVGWQARK
jgi:hypothetical protein